MSDFFCQVFFQGLLEAFPISSSMHLRIFNVNNIEIMHLGTGIAFLFYAFQTLKTYIKKPFCKKSIFFFFKILIIILPTVLIGFYIKKQPLLVPSDSVNLICALTMLCVNLSLPMEKEFKQLSVKQLFFIAFIVPLSLLPGASRFGITFTAFRLFKLNLHESFLFSIILGIPITIGAALLNVYTQTITTKLLLASLIAGIITYFTLKITHKALKYWNFFSVYRIIFSFIHFFLTPIQKKALLSKIFLIIAFFFESPETSKNKNSTIEKHKKQSKKVKKD
ncbi:undecaprenyl-diphosphate phosphatase [Alphaproteobacteria bacterium endosymbiont of Tiliacea citrago]|uniref:undecaprenyl-diphosphate phosphatase n=1 Tax=Alphaproteobacteria bacterium endosymbiont of Tiliacea citrago TaxID=3077944 RepID=UPI00313DD361